MRAPRFLGVTVMPEYIQTEGIDRLLDNVVGKAGVTAVATSPYVMAEADVATGSREPPIDAGAGAVRLLDRPLWGKRELFVTTAPSFEPDHTFYRDLRYQPAPPSDLTRRHGRIIGDFLAAAQARHLKVYLQVQAAIPPGYRVQFGGPVEDDQPRLPDGRIPPRRLDKNGSLASPHIRAYTCALLRDLCRAYPGIDGIRVDWPEYPPYLLDSVFLDFSRHAQEAAARLGFDFERIRAAAAELYQLLHGRLGPEDLTVWSEPDGGRYRLLRALGERPGLTEWLRFKAVLVEELLASFRRTLDEAAGGRVELVPNAFPPPFTLASGFDFARAARHSAAISVKLYTMHWPMMLRFYGEAILSANTGLAERDLVRALVRWMDIDDGEGLNTLAAYAYPEPEAPHPVGAAAQARKIRQAQYEAGAVPVYPLAHGYGPLEDFKNRLRTAWRASPHGVWINRYGYLSDRKLEAIGEICMRE